LTVSFALVGVNLKCPACEARITRVLDSRPFKAQKAVRRRRICPDCDFRFVTEENVLVEAPILVKKDGRREAFSASKLKSGIQAACQKRPVSQSQIESLVSKIERKIVAKGASEVHSDIVGKYVMSELKKLDEVAYVRFASVYMTFKEVNEFFKSLENEWVR